MEECQANFIQIANCLLSFWIELPAEFKAKLPVEADVVTENAEVRTRTRPHRLGASQEMIKLSPTIKPFFEQWRNSPSHFYTRTGFELGGRHNSVDRVRARVLCLIFCNCTTAALKRSLLRGTIALQLAGVIHQSKLIDDSLEVIQNNLGMWVGRGRRYRRLVEGLGAGSLILLPNDVSESL
jgi:hypothetical protein